MKTRNDILAEYVRSRYPEIEKTFDFVAYEVLECAGKEVDDVCDSESEDR